MLLDSFTKPYPMSDFKTQTTEHLCNHIVCRTRQSNPILDVSDELEQASYRSGRCGKQVKYSK